LSEQNFLSDRPLNGSPQSKHTRCISSPFLINNKYVNEITALHQVAEKKFSTDLVNIHHLTVNLDYQKTTENRALQANELHFQKCKNVLRKLLINRHSGRF
jgi:hypothetical protein